MSIGHSELWLEQFEWWEANFYERHFHAPTPPICATEFFSSSVFKVPSYQYTFYWYTPKGISKFYWKTWKIWTFECQKLFFLGGGVIFEHFRQIDNFETPEKKYLKMIWTPFLFSSFLSILSKGENNDLEGKSSHLPYFLAPQKIAKMAKNRWRSG